MRLDRAHHLRQQLGPGRKGMSRIRLREVEGLICVFSLMGMFEGTVMHLHEGSECGIRHDHERWQLRPARSTSDVLENLSDRGVVQCDRPLG